MPPIGIFDSGVGGLTVLAALRRRLPHEQFVYLGDTARVPYGSKSPDVVRRYAYNCASFLAARGAKLIVIACNTASAVALDHLEEFLGVPVIGVIEPSAHAACAVTRGRVGVIGTEATIASGRYPALLAEIAPHIDVQARACPLLVPLAEEGLVVHPATHLIASEYLAPLLEAGIDTLVLGCTHYPLLTPTIAAICGPGVTIVDSASACAESVASLVQRRGVAAAHREGGDRFFATDVGARFCRVGSTFLGEAIDAFEWVDVASTEPTALREVG